MQEDVYQGDGLNLYAYCGNNPVVYDDPSGYASTSTGKACPPKAKISESVDESGTSSVAKPNHGQGFSSKGYNPKPGERTRDQRQRGTEPYHRQDPGDRQRY